QSGCDSAGDSLTFARFEAAWRASTRPGRERTLRMSGAAVNNYKADLRAIQFTLYEHLHVEQVFEHETFSHLSREECDATVEQCLRFVNEFTGPLNGQADRVGCILEKGVTRTPSGFKEAWRKLFELGFMSFPMAIEAGGFGGPHAI